MSGPDLAAARAQARAAQQQVITADPPFAVIACPGAGKTRVIVDRHLSPCRARPAGPRHHLVHPRGRRRGPPPLRGRRPARPDRPPALHRHPRHLPVAAPGPPVPAPDRVWRRLESWRDAPDKSAEFACGQTYHLADADFGYDPARTAWSVRPDRSRSPGPATRQLGLARLPHPRRP